MIQKTRELKGRAVVTLWPMINDLAPLASEPDLELEAVDPARNINRRYSIRREPDLFGWFIVSWSWGRADRTPRDRVQAFADEVAAIAFGRRLLARRGTAPRRIGVAYRRR